MKRSVFALAVVVTLAGCAPEQRDVTLGCDSISDCPLGDVCDRELGECVPEPEDRFLGAFRCTVGIGPEIQELSEVVGAIGSDRWALPGALCWLTETQDFYGNPVELLTLAFHSPLGSGSLLVKLRLAGLADRRGELGLVMDERFDSASLEDLETFTAYGYSKSGSVQLSQVPKPGDTIEGYLDVTMLATPREDALWGAPCPRGLADCGDKTIDAGGVAFCTNLLNGPVCTSSCATGGNGACSVGDGVCVQDMCTKECVNHADCAGGLRCTLGNAGEPSGCF